LRSVNLSNSPIDLLAHDLLLHCRMPYSTDEGAPQCLISSQSDADARNIYRPCKEPGKLGAEREFPLLAVPPDCCRGGNPGSQLSSHPCTPHSVLEGMGNVIMQRAVRCTGA